MTEKLVVMMRPLFFAVILSFSFCGSSESYETTTVTLQTSSASLAITAEVADTGAKRSQGLMNRTSLAEDAGMLFVFDEASERSFWMKDTYVSLDIIFIGSDKAILYIEENATPLSETPIAPEVQTQFVLEVNAGYAAEHGLNVGDEVRF